MKQGMSQLRKLLLSTKNLSMDGLGTLTSLLLIIESQAFKRRLTDA